jgi:Mg2+ and Co2+ transporter CorA
MNDEKWFIFTNEHDCWAVMAKSQKAAIKKLAATADAMRSDDPKDYIQDIEDGIITVFTPTVIK